MRDHAIVFSHYCRSAVRSNSNALSASALGHLARQEAVFIRSFVQLANADDTSYEFEVDGVAVKGKIG